jgi:hypothetical protein
VNEALDEVREAVTVARRLAMVAILNRDLLRARVALRDLQEVAAKSTDNADGENATGAPERL